MTEELFELFEKMLKDADALFGGDVYLHDLYFDSHPSLNLRFIDLSVTAITEERVKIVADGLSVLFNCHVDILLYRDGVSFESIAYDEENDQLQEDE